MSTDRQHDDSDKVSLLHEHRSSSSNNDEESQISSENGNNLLSHLNSHKNINRSCKNMEHNNKLNNNGGTGFHNGITITRETSPSPYLARLCSALFYGIASFLITVVNKLVLTSCKFPSFQVLALGQIVSTVVILFVAKALKLVTFPNLGRDTFRKIFPLPLLFIGNAISGLGGTKELSLPMFTALRRFSILLTMLAELYVLGIRPSVAVQFSVYTMVGGALLAACNDLSFTTSGYCLIMLNNLFTAANGVYTKKKLESKEYGKYGLMYYNALFVLVPTIMFTYFTGEIEKAIEYDRWFDPIFLLYFTLSCVMGFVLNASVVICTQHNSALTTTIVGCLKNVSIAYLGMFIGGDYVFQLLNFVGINISILGSLVYTYVTFRRH